MSESRAEGRLLALLTACFYGLFTLLPDSHSLTVKWSWVAIWQIGLLCPVLWLLWQLWHWGRVRSLGNGLDWCIGLGMIGLLVSSIFAQFPNQARWYGWWALCFLAALYALNNYLDNSDRRDRVLATLGYVGLFFVIISLSLWTTQTLMPELARLESLKQYGVNLPFDFSVLELRNWAPLGHQNYVAGYLMLILPLFAGLSILRVGWRRYLWLIALGLGLLDLYSTSSRGGWLGLFALCLFGLGVLLFGSRIPKLWLAIGGMATIALLLLLVFANNRLRTLIVAILQNPGGGELAYRLINAALGWQMGSDRPWAGIGIGGVPFAYQKYRPIWAGRESELAYQLHSTPVHLWAELGIWGIIPVLGAIALLVYWLVRHQLRQTPIAHGDRILLWSLYGGLLAYGIISLTDYQLDNVAISGAIVIYLACIASILKSQKSDLETRYLKSPQKSKFNLPFYAGLGILLTALIWLIPIHRAWQLSSQGFLALSQEKVEIFVDRLTRAHQLAPWEPYYPYQLGWNLGDLALQTKDPRQRQQLLNESIAWLQKGNTISPYQEFGYSNLGWLLLQSDPKAASQAFARAARLVRAKRGVMFGLGLSLLGQRKADLAIEAFSLEGLRDPLFITSPVWRSQGLQPIYSQVLDRMATHYQELLQQYSQSGEMNAYLHRSRGGLYWWQGNLKAARADWEAYKTPLSQTILALAEGKSPQAILSQPPSSPEMMLIQAWENPSQRANLLRQAWILATKTELPAEMERDLLASMERSDNFDRWVKQNAPVWQYRRQRLGFGVLSRHIDGSIPTDFWIVADNIAMTTWFAELLPSPVYMPELDLALQPWQDAVIKEILP